MYLLFGLNSQCLLQNIQGKYQLPKKLPYLPKPKMLLLSMDLKLLFSTYAQYVKLAFTKSQSGRNFTFYLQIRVFKYFFVCVTSFTDLQGKI